MTPGNVDPRSFQVKQESLRWCFYGDEYSRGRILLKKKTVLNISWTKKIHAKLINSTALQLLNLKSSKILAFTGCLKTKDSRVITSVPRLQGHL